MVNIGCCGILLRWVCNLFCCCFGFRMFVFCWFGLYLMCEWWFFCVCWRVKMWLLLFVSVILMLILICCLMCICLLLWWWVVSCFMCMWVWFFVCLFIVFRVVLLCLMSGRLKWCGCGGWVMFILLRNGFWGSVFWLCFIIMVVVWLLVLVCRWVLGGICVKNVRFVFGWWMWCVRWRSWVELGMSIKRVCWVVYFVSLVGIFFLV